MTGHVTEFLLYGLDDAGRPVFSELLRDAERGALASLARERLRDCHAVEIWDGPMCVVRVRRSDLAADRSGD